MAKIDFIAELGCSVTIALDVHPNSNATYGDLRKFVNATSGHSDDTPLTFLIDPNYGAEADCQLVSPVELPTGDD